MRREAEGVTPASVAGIAARGEAGRAVAHSGGPCRCTCISTMIANTITTSSRFMVVNASSVQHDQQDQGCGRHDDDGDDPRRSFPAPHRPQPG